MSYDKAGREALGRIEDQANRIIARCKKENRNLNAKEKKEFEGLMGDYKMRQNTVLENEGNNGGFRNGIDIAGGLEEMRDKYRTNPRQQRERADGEHGQAFDAYLRNGLSALNDDQRSLVTRGADMSALAGLNFKNAQSGNVGSAGGFLVPQGFSDMLMTAMKWYGGIDGVTGSFTTETGNPWPWPTLNDTGNKGRIIGQNVQVIETDLTFGQVTFNSYILSSDLVLIPMALLQDAFFDMDQLLADLLGTRLGRLLNQKCTIGSGSGEPTGIVTAAVAAGLINQFPNGETTSIAYNDLVNLEHAVDPAYRNGNARWMFSDTVLKLLKKLVDGNNRPLWQPGLTASFGEGAPVLGAGKPTILGHEYVINQDMATPGASAYSMLFGDMSTFKLRKVGAPQVLRLQERYADYLQVGYLAFFRCDSNLVDAGTHPIVVGQNSAS